jgi:hypothetical protein
MAIVACHRRRLEEALSYLWLFAMISHGLFATHHDPLHRATTYDDFSSSPATKPPLTCAMLSSHKFDTSRLGVFSAVLRGLLIFAGAVVAARSRRAIRAKLEERRNILFTSGKINHCRLMITWVAVNSPMH